MRDNASHDQGKPYITAATVKARREGSIAPDAVMEQRWAIVARAAIAQYDGAKFGARAIKSAALAEKHDVSPTYLRHAIVTYRFVQTGLIDSVRLSTFPIGIVDELKRWSAFNLPEATAAAESFADEALSHEAFIAEARKARARHEAAEQTQSGRHEDAAPERAPEPVTSELPHRVASAMRGWARQELLQTHEGYVSFRDVDGLAQNYVTARSKDGKTHVAAVLTGPFSDDELELARCRDAILQALGLLMSYEEVMLVCASDRAASYARRRIADMRRAKGLSWRGEAPQARLTVRSYQQAMALQETVAAPVAAEAAAGDLRDATAKARRALNGREDARQARSAGRSGPSSAAPAAAKARTKKRAR